MKKYKYVGTDRTSAANQLLFNGCVYDLPENDPHVKSLVAKKLLIVQDSKTPTKK